MRLDSCLLLVLVPPSTVIWDSDTSFGFFFFGCAFAFRPSSTTPEKKILSNKINKLDNFLVYLDK
jgi:hypothetical protein